MAKKKTTKAKRSSKSARKATKKASRRAAPKATKRTIPKRKAKAAPRRSAAAKKKPAAKVSKRPTRKSAPKRAPEKMARKPAATKAPHRLPSARRHSVETDEPRERAGDGDEKAFVGTDTQEDEAKELGEEFVRSVTSGEEAESEMEEEEAVEEQGGPFVQTSASTEYGFGTDESNPPDAEKSAFPQVSPAVNPSTDGEDEDQ